MHGTRAWLAAWCVAACLMPVALSAQAPPQSGAGAGVGIVQGVASTQDGSVRLPGAVIQMFDATGAQVAELLSGDDGTFTVPNLPPGTYRFVSSLMGFRTTEASVTIARGATSPRRARHAACGSLRTRGREGAARGGTDRRHDRADLGRHRQGARSVFAEQRRAGRAAAARVGDRRARRRQHQGRALQSDRRAGRRGQPRRSDNRPLVFDAAGRRHRIGGRPAESVRRRVRPLLVGRRRHRDAARRRSMGAAAERSRSEPAHRPRQPVQGDRPDGVRAAVRGRGAAARAARVPGTDRAVQIPDERGPQPGGESN